MTSRKLSDLFSFFLIIFVGTAQASNWEPSSKDTLKLSLGFLFPTYNLEIQAPKTISNKKARLEPNLPGKTFAGLAYRNLGISGSASTKPNEESVLNNGSSSASDFQFRFYGKRTYEFTYQKYSGYYIKNSEELDPSFSNTNVKIKRPDIETRNLSANIFWNFYEEDFTLRIALDQEGLQKSSGWSSFATIGVADSLMIGTSPFIPSTSTSQFGELGTLKGLQRFSLTGGGGLGGILTAMNFYASAVIILAVGTHNITYEQQDTQPKKVSDSGSFGSFRASLGYNGERHVLAANYIADTINSEILQGTVSGVTGEFKLFYAYRFTGVNIPFLNPISALLD